jgi:MarR family transcriptional regulator for hemolysin
VVSDIADSLDVSNAAASQMVERLVNLELIGRSEDPEDRRVKQITLTMKGRQLIQDSIDARQRWMQEMTDALTPEEQESISVALTTLTEAALAMENTLEQECTPEVV